MPMNNPGEVSAENRGSTENVAELPPETGLEATRPPTMGSPVGLRPEAV